MLNVSAKLQADTIDPKFAIPMGFCREKIQSYRTVKIEDQTTRFVQSGLHLHCLPKILKLHQAA